MAEAQVRTITEAKALAAMANPVRSRILDALKVDGPSTASALAARTGQAVGSASHHWLRLSQDELRELNGELLELLRRWAQRPTPDDAEREPVFLFARAFPAQP